MLLTILMSEKLCMLSYVNITSHMTGDIHKIQKQLSYMHRSILYHWLYLLIKSKRKNDDSLRTNIFLQTYRISYRNKFFQKEFNLRLYEGLKEKKWILISIRKITFQNTCRKYLYVILSCKKYIAYQFTSIYFYKTLQDVLKCFIRY